MYTNGIRKIFNSNFMAAGTKLIDIQALALEAGYRALSFNGIVYCFDDGMFQTWYKTPFLISDFSDQ